MRTLQLDVHLQPRNYGTHRCRICPNGNPMKVNHLRKHLLQRRATHFKNYTNKQIDDDLEMCRISGSSRGAGAAVLDDASLTAGRGRTRAVSGSPASARARSNPAHAAEPDAHAQVKIDVHGRQYSRQHLEGQVTICCEGRKNNVKCKYRNLVFKNFTDHWVSCSMRCASCS